MVYVGIRYVKGTELFYFYGAFEHLTKDKN